MDDLIAFYEAQLDEDEQLAQAAVSSHQREPRMDECIDASHWAVRYGDYGGTKIVDGDGHDVVAEASDRGGAVRSHIARHDPARVVADVEADRKLLAAYGDLAVRVSENNQKVWRLKQMAPDDVEQITSTNRHGERLAGRLEGLIYALQVRVERYADDPGYKETWRP